jgi:hypothetical protein
VGQILVAAAVLALLGEVAYYLAVPVELVIGASIILVGYAAAVF